MGVRILGAFWHGGVKNLLRTHLASNPSGATLGGMLTVPALTAWPPSSTSGLTRWVAATVSGHQPRLERRDLVPFNMTEQLVVTTLPNTVSAGNPFGLVVSVEDAAGKVDTAFNGIVTVADASGTRWGAR